MKINDNLNDTNSYINKHLMSKLYYRYGVMGSSKTRSLLAVVHNYKLQKKNILTMKPVLDVRTGNKIQSRDGSYILADFLIDDQTDIMECVNEVIKSNKELSCILVDEAQFLSSKNVKDLRYISSFLNIPVICYGLKTDYKGLLFPGSYTLLCLADSIEEIKTTCWFCNKKAIMNMKHDNGKPVFDGSDKPDLGFEDKYLPVCYNHYCKIEK